MREIIEKKCLAVCIFPKCCSSLSGPTFPARILPLVKRRSLIFVPLNLGRHVRLRQVDCSRTFEAGLEKTVWFPLDSLSLSLRRLTLESSQLAVRKPKASHTERPHGGTMWTGAEPPLGEPAATSRHASERAFR